MAHSMSERTARGRHQAPGGERAARPSKSGPKRGSSQLFMLAPTVSIPALLDEVGGGDRDFRQLLYDIAIAAAHLEAARSYLAGHMGVTSPQYNMMMVIAQYEDRAGISVSDIASHLHVSNTFVTSESKKLIEAGLLDKLPNPADARGVLLRLTPKGEARVGALEPELLFVNDHLFRHLSREDFRGLARTVASLIDDFTQTIAILGAMTNRQRGPRALADSATAVKRLGRKA